MNEIKKRRSETLCVEYDDSIKELYSGYFDPLVIYIRTQFRSCPQQAEDIAQNAFEKIAAKKNLGRITNIKAFLWRTAYNIAISGIRSKGVAAKYQAETKRLFSCDEEYSLTPERVLEAREQVEIAKDVLRRMPEQRRRAFILTRIEGLSHDEASKRLGISRPAVSKHVARATADLYGTLNNKLEYDIK